ncbi:putative ribonuclease H-like domain-containing protein [Tanacetum coccineum]
MSTIKLSYLKKGEYDIWAMKMEHYLAHTGTTPFMKVIKRGNGLLKIHTENNERNKGVATLKLLKETLAKEKRKEYQLKMLRALPSSWSQISLVIRTKPGVDNLNFDNLYNNLRAFKADVKGSTGSSLSTQNVAFVSSESADNHEDLEQLNEFDLEEMDLKWQVAMISMTLKKFHNKSGRKIQFDAKEPVRFARTKVECYNCHKTGHFAREKARESNALITLDGEGIDWTAHAEDEEDNFALMAFSNSGSDTEVTSCSKECVESYTKLKKLYDEQREQLGDASIEIQAYTQALKKVEAKLVAYQQNQLWYEEKIRFMKVDLDDKTDVLTYHKKLLAEALKEKEELKTKFENWQNSSKNLGKLLNTQMSANDKFGLGDCDFHEKRMAKQAELNKRVCKGTGLRENRPDDPHKALKNKGIVDSGCSRHMTGNKAYLVDYQDYNGGPVAFGRRLGHVNFKNLNKLVKGNLVRGLPSKVFQNDHTCVACQKGKQHKASCKAKSVSSISQPLQLLHMDLFRPTSVRSINHKTYCLVITDDFSRVLVTKPQNKTPYELITGKIPIISYIRPFGCHVTILNTIDHLGKIKEKADEGKGPTWLFDLDYLTDSMNYQPVRLENQANKSKSLKETNHSKGTQVDTNAGNSILEDEPVQEYCVLPSWSFFTLTTKSSETKNGDDNSKEDIGLKSKEKLVDKEEHAFLEELERLKRQEPEANDSAEALRKEIAQVSTASPSRAFSTGESFSPVLINNADQDDSQIPALEDIYDNPSEGVFTNATYDDEGVVTDFTNLETFVEVSPIAKSRIHSIHPTSQILGDPKSTVQTRSKVDKGLAHALVSYVKKQRRNNHKDVKSAFLYGTIDEEVYVSQPPVFIDPKHPKKVYKVVKDLYGLHQAPKAWYGTLSAFLKQSGYIRRTIDKTLFNKKDKKDIMLVQVYVDDIIFGSTKKSWCDEIEALMKNIFQMSSMGELTFFLGLQVKQKADGIFISQDKYVGEILKKFDFMSVKHASTPIKTHKPLVKDEEAANVDVHLYRSMIGSLMYLTASRPDIMFTVCACSRFQVTPKTLHLHVVKRIFRYLKGKPKLGLWYPKESSFDLVAYSDSDYGGANLYRKSIIGGCQFLGHRLISWQCKKQTIMATSTTEAEYVAAANC